MVPVPRHRAAVARGADGRAAETLQVEAPDPNVDSTFDQARELAKEQVERHLPTSRPDDGTPLIR